MKKTNPIPQSSPEIHLLPISLSYWYYSRQNLETNAAYQPAALNHTLSCVYVSKNAPISLSMIRL